MRRFLLSIVAFALALTASAQVSVQQQQEKYRVVEYGEAQWGCEQGTEEDCKQPTLGGLLLI